MKELKQDSQKNIFSTGTKWLLTNNINGYENIESNELATEIISGRKFEIISEADNIDTSNKNQRVKARLLEDGYICFLDLKEIKEQVKLITNWKPQLFSKEEIKKQIPKILNWIEITSRKPNYYLWGGTLGPNFDCSGLIQTAFSLRKIWIPRDAYQQEIFCKKIEFDRVTLEGIMPGDLIFFGKNEKCSHVGIYINEGFYWHSSGERNGRNGIGKDSLKIISKNAISSYYQSILRGAGRIESCHDGTELINHENNV